MTVGLALSSPTAGVLGTPNTAVLTITDVDTPGALEFGSATMIVSPGATVANVTVLRVGGTVGTVSAAYATSAGTAVPGTDYTSVSGVGDLQPRRHQRDDRGSDPEQYRGEQQDVLPRPEQPQRRRNPGDPGHVDDHDRAAERSAYRSS